MADKPKRTSEYKSEQVELVRATCLYVATKLGDLMAELVVVGGLVPSLLVDQERLAEGATSHVGTMDLDVGSLWRCWMKVDIGNSRSGCRTRGSG